MVSVPVSSSSPPPSEWRRPRPVAGGSGHPTQQCNLNLMLPPLCKGCRRHRLTITASRNISSIVPCADRRLLISCVCRQGLAAAVLGVHDGGVPVFLSKAAWAAPPRPAAALAEATHTPRAAPRPGTEIDSVVYAWCASCRPCNSALTLAWCPLGAAAVLQILQCSSCGCKKAPQKRQAFLPRSYDDPAFLHVDHEVVRRQDTPCTHTSR